MPRRRTYTTLAILSVPVAAAGLLGTTLAGGAAGATNGPAKTPTLTSTVFASGASLTHPTAHGAEALSNPDDITALGSHIFVAFQNGVGPQGEASTTGNQDSTIVEFNGHGGAVRQWDVLGKVDGLTADPNTRRLIATVNEDANSSIYLIKPKAGTTPVHFVYNEALPHLGGTDAISIYRGMTLVSASAPGTTGTVTTYPAVYRLVFDASTHVATVTPYLSAQASARVANVNSTLFGTTTQLNLTDADSNEVVPWFAPRFAGDFMLTSQGDLQQIFVHGARSHLRLSVLNLSAAVDDTAWASSRWGALYTTDGSANTIYTITGRFHRGQVFVATTPCSANAAPATCPGPGYPADYLGQLNPHTGQIATVNVVGPTVQPKGMIFLPR